MLMKIYKTLSKQQSLDQETSAKQLHLERPAELQESKFRITVDLATLNRFMALLEMYNSTTLSYCA